MNEETGEEVNEVERIMENNLIFSINNKEKTAYVIDNYKASGEIFIPRSILHKDQDFIVTRIKEGSFKDCTTIDSISFPDDSEIDTIEKDAFYNSSLKLLFIPSSISNLNEGWCRGTPNLNLIKLCPNNERYIYLNNSMIIEKNDKMNDIYDKIVFARRDIKDIIIPTFIKNIGSYSFSETLLEKVEIPFQITKISEGSFTNANNFKKLKFQIIQNLK